ncbi:MAG: hypothetical protein MJ010_03930 [Paludibacteraceae bacterium]|nr:hypothetical protein [Paludibacteraceae bacterium]
MQRMHLQEVMLPDVLTIEMDIQSTAETANVHIKHALSTLSRMVVWAILIKLLLLKPDNMLYKLDILRPNDSCAIAAILGESTNLPSSLESGELFFSEELHGIIGKPKHEWKRVTLCKQNQGILLPMGEYKLDTSLKFGFIIKNNSKLVGSDDKVIAALV